MCARDAFCHAGVGVYWSSGTETNDVIHRQQWSSRLREQLVNIRKNETRRYPIELYEGAEGTNLVKVVWCKSEEMPADLFTKNLSGPLFKKHTKIFCGDDEHG